MGLSDLTFLGSIPVPIKKYIHTYMHLIIKILIRKIKTNVI